VENNDNAYWQYLRIIFFSYHDLVAIPAKNFKIRIAARHFDRIADFEHVKEIIPHTTKKEMKFTRIRVTATAIAASIALPTIFMQNAFAGPAIAFTYKYSQMRTSQCMRRGISVLTNEGLLRPDNTINENNTSFVIGEDREITTIVDCSEVARSGRITVMIARSSNPRIALDRAKALLDRIVFR
jgi:hypothetical protein